MTMTTTQTSTGRTEPRADKVAIVEEITALLHQNELNANVIVSFGQFLDIVPARASKGQALRYVALRLDIPFENILVAGGSGADEDMIRGKVRAGARIRVSAGDGRLDFQVVSEEPEPADAMV